jgi:hypothetical protein
LATHMNMDRARQHPPVILLLGSQGCDQVDRWLEASRFTTSKVSDAFQALEQISDFTVRDRPDVIFLHVDSIADELAFMRNIVATASNEPDVPIIGFSGDETTGADSISSLASRLGQLIPQSNSVM